MFSKFKSLITDFKNFVDFSIRKRIRIEREFCPENETKEDVFECLEGEKAQLAELKEIELCKNYHLVTLKNNSLNYTYLENLAIIEVLEHCLEIGNNQDNLEVLDIGSKNWSYAQSEYNFFKYNNHAGRNIKINGIEIDAFRVYTDLHTRYDYAKYHIKELENAEYIVDDVMNHKSEYDYITWFFPFLTPIPIERWGLPKTLLKPEKMLLHAYSLLKEGGKMIILNQGAKEYQIQQELYEKLNIPHALIGRVESSFINLEKERFASVVIK